MKPHSIPLLTGLLAALAGGQLASAAITILPTEDGRGENGASVVNADASNNFRLGVGPVTGSTRGFRSYLTFDLTSETTATDVTVSFFDAGANESNTTVSFTQNLTLFQLGSDWDGSLPNPGMTLATVQVTLGTGNPAANLSFNSTALTTAFNNAVGGPLYLGLYSPEGEAASTSTRSFLWLSSLESSVDGGGSDSGARPSLTYTAVPEPSAALLGGVCLLALLRRRRSA